MARRTNSPIEDVLDITSKFPWWLGVTLAAISYFALHWYTMQEPPKAEGLNGLYSAVLPGILRSFAMFGQIILPFVFLFGAVVSAGNRFKRKKLYDDTVNNFSDNALEGMSWQDFELLVGEHYRRQGFVVEETSGGADGGIDLIATKNGEKYLVQCKQWKAYKVGVKVVRELLGVMVGGGAIGGFVVTSGEFTRDAVSFSRDNNIVLLDGKALRRMIREQSKLQDLPKRNVTLSQPQGSTKHICPQCGEALVLRTARKGRNQGKRFYGCSSFPKCRYTKTA